MATIGHAIYGAALGTIAARRHESKSTVASPGRAITCRSSASTIAEAGLAPSRTCSER